MNDDKAKRPDLDIQNIAPGITKREYFAAMALQGLLARKENKLLPTYIESNVSIAMKYADELLKHS